MIDALILAAGVVLGVLATVCGFLFARQWPMSRKGRATESDDPDRKPGLFSEWKSATPKITQDKTE